jgi:hypothetical protein
MKRTDLRFCAGPTPPRFVRTLPAAGAAKGCLLTAYEVMRVYLDWVSARVGTASAFAGNFNRARIR